MMDEEYWDAEYWEHVRRCDENGKATANNMPNDAIISVLHAALIVYITECREVGDADGEMYARQAQEWLDKPYSHRNGETEPPTVEGFYFVVARYGVNVVRLAKGALTQCGDANRYQVPIRAEVAYYGPIPEPQQEDNAQ